MNLALIQLDGRYPKAGYTLNQEAEALVQIVRGSGALHLKNGSSTALSQGDQVYLAKNEAYSFEGKLELLYAATPKWTPEQTKHITE